jgi:hypothetical protein
LNGLDLAESPPIPTSAALATSTSESLSSCPIEPADQVVAQVVSEHVPCTKPFGALAKLTALAAAVEAMSTGHARVLAAELRAELEALSGPCATVVNLATRRDR